MRDRASPTALERNITFRVTEGTGDVMGVEISVDGTKILFAMRGPVDEDLDLDDPDQPNWNIWEYVIATDTLRRLIASDITARARPRHFAALPAGRPHHLRVDAPAARRKPSCSTRQAAVRGARRGPQRAGVSCCM